MTEAGGATMSNILEFRRKRTMCDRTPSAATASAAHAVWRGDARTGCGAISVASAERAERAYSFVTSLASGSSTNAAELLAAAHATCFTTSLSTVLRAAGYTPSELSTQAVVTLEPDGAGHRVTMSALKVRAKIPNLTRSAFEAMAWHAEQRSAVSNVLNAQVSLDAALL